MLLACKKFSLELWKFFYIEYMYIHKLNMHASEGSDLLATMKYSILKIQIFLTDNHDAKKNRLHVGPIFLASKKM